MKKTDSPKIDIEEQEFPGFSGQTIKIRKARNGVVNFSNILIETCDADNKKITNSEIPGFKWQSFSELSEDHGHAVICDVLHPIGLYILKDEKRSQIILEIKSKSSSSSWVELENYSAEIQNKSPDENMADVFIVAAWAELFAEPFQEVWLAAMAHHAIYLREDDYAFGYLTALLDQKKLTEKHFLRGREILKSASLGGLAKSNASGRKTRQTIAELARLMQAGHSVARASSLAFKNGFGTSPAANRKLWNRQSKNRDSARQGL